jgi:hypothetical protein
VLLVRETAGGTEVVIARSLANGTAIGRFGRDYLLNSSALARSGMETCVFAGSLQGIPVFCTASAFASMRPQTASQGSTSAFTWSDGRETWLAAHWELFIRCRAPPLRNRCPCCSGRRRKRWC